MIPTDLKNYRARSSNHSGWRLVEIVCLVLLIAWIGGLGQVAQERHLRVTQAQCE